MTKTQQEILSSIADDCGVRRAPVDGHRACMAARKLQEMGMGRFESEGYWDRNAKGSIARFISGGYFYPAEA